MQNYTGIIIAVENYNNSEELGSVMFANNDAEAVYNAFINLGCNPDKISIIKDKYATKTTIEEAIKQKAQYATEFETIILYYAGHGFFHKGKNLISCVDTSLRALESTTIDLNFILASLDESKSTKAIAFLDCCHSGIEFDNSERSPVSNFSADDIKYEYGDAEHLTVFASCKSNEKSQCDMERSHGVWSYYLVKALSGNERSIYEGGSILLSDKLQKYLSEETTQRVRLITKGKNQTPVKFGKETSDKFIVADLTLLVAQQERIRAASASTKLDTIIRLVAHEDGWVRDLPGFKSNNRVPKDIDEYHANWIKSIAEDLIQSDTKEKASKFKSYFNYKRNSIITSSNKNGVGQVTTTDFTYIVQIYQSSSRADKFILTRTIEGIRDINIINNKDLNKLFKNQFSMIEFDIAMNAEDVIDKIEDIDDVDVISVEYDDANTNTCEVYLDTLYGSIEITEDSIIIELDTKKDLQNLIKIGHDSYERLVDLIN